MTDPHEVDPFGTIKMNLWYMAHPHVFDIRSDSQSFFPEVKTREKHALSIDHLIFTSKSWCVSFKPGSGVLTTKSCRNAINMYRLNTNCPSYPRYISFHVVLQLHKGRRRDNFESHDTHHIDGCRIDEHGTVHREKQKQGARYMWHAIFASHVIL